MAITETVTCDVCGKQKGSVNHWWMFTVCRTNPDLPELDIAPWNEDYSEQFDHACGQECLIKAVNEWMQGQGSLSALPVSKETK